VDEHLADADWTAGTPNTRRTAEALRADLDRFRVLGYSVDDEENEVGSRCVGAPILDGAGRPVAAISISAPTPRMTDETLALVGARLVDTCKKLGSVLA
jgi:IclR family transcriptional regulator, acetate operon repressor